MLRYYGELLYCAQKSVGDKGEAKDIIQEAYIRVLGSRDKYETEDQRAYLYRIAKDIVIKEALEDQKLQTTLFEENLHFGPSCKRLEEIIFQGGQEKIFMQIIEKLPQRAKEAYILHTIEGYNRKGIGNILDIISNVVERLIKRASLKVEEESAKGGF